MLIWKACLPMDTLDICKVKLPFSSVAEAKQHILKVDMQYDRPVMWFQADDDTDGKVKRNKNYIIQGIGTGHPYLDDKWRRIINKDSYIGTASLMSGVLILHYFIGIEKDYEAAFALEK